MSIKIYPYKQGSRSARALAEALGGRVLRREGSCYRYHPGDLIINWGASDCPFHGAINQSVIHNPMAAMSNKLSAFQLFSYVGVNIPNFWTNPQDIPADAYPIVCRTLLQGHSGAGIVVAETPDQLVPAPLYTQYMKKKDEYRIHLMGESIIAVQRKAKRRGEENINTRIRNHDNGYVYVREGVVAPAQCVEQAQAALVASGLDFGAVDVIWNDHYQRATVLEINTAPGLEGRTIQDYADAFRALL